MTIGLPQHLARQTLSGAIAMGSGAAAFVSLGAAGLIAIVLAAAGDVSALVALLVVIVMAILLTLLVRTRTVAAASVYLVAGSVGVFIFTLEVLGAPGGYSDTSNLLVGLPHIALLLGGGTAAGAGAGLAWVGAGFGGGLIAAICAAEMAGAAVRPNTPVLLALGLIVIVLVFDGFTRGDAHQSDHALQRARREARELDIRRDYELRATARLHDTALSHLLAIASSPLGPLDAALRSAVERDVAFLVEREWFRPAGGSGPASMQRAVLGETVARSATRGVRVTVSGDASALGDLDPEAAAAIVDAVDQSLANVARHAGVDAAEIVVAEIGGRLTVAVVDAGRGFDTETVAHDRLGLRASIIGLVSAVGGDVRIWSTPGAGTTILLSVPLGVRATGEEAP
ncbi:sensor histidine kinase [Agromyces atrinae]|uniref:Histidine kinase/HSP90-like ATPase domain-containing protein n=1 Tax=Agromyces atrinae TaxID=592376 RepID=A0A4V1R2L6_9MICO|nr:ATP-binding protein [Agromyces atrinae]NYD66942.1 hypothetical protein [Agromyces atrinae]RXZ87586.1 hypothetical protein ESP50_06635 [Agromyces atrinae]